MGVIVADTYEADIFERDGMTFVRYPDGDEALLADVMRYMSPDMEFDNTTGEAMASMPPRPDAPDSGVVTPNAGWDWSTGEGRNAIKDRANAWVESLVPPNLRGLFSMLADVNPVRDMEQAGTAARGLFSPDASGTQRAAFLGDMLSNMAPMLGPVAAAKAGMPVAKAVMEGLLGWAPDAEDAIARGLADESGALRLGGKSPAQEVADLLASGRAADVTDDMLAKLTPNDNAELFRLYQSGATGADMPMDAASRMQRAEGMGFDTGTPLYHGTGADFQAFDAARFGQSDHGAKGRGVYSSQDPDLASSYSTLVAEDGRQVYPLSYAVKTPYDGEIPMAMYDEGRSIAFTDNLINAGYDGVMRPNSRRGGELTEAVAFKPADVRSRFARFDPRLSHLRNLSAGAAGLLALFGLPDDTQAQTQGPR